jgi:hypothetical protein
MKVVPLVSRYHEDHQGKYEEYQLSYLFKVLHVEQRPGEGLLDIKGIGTLISLEKMKELEI